MKKLLLVFAALSAMGACAAAASPQAQVAMANAAQASAADLAAPPPAPAAERAAASSRMACDILTRPTSHGVAISAVLRADDAVSGDYNLVITKIGQAGSSDVNQAGPFDASRGQRVTLTETELGLDRGDRFHAVLKLTDAAGRVCRQESRS